MNKRIRKKKQKNKNVNTLKKVFNELKKNFKIYDVKTGDGYFVFNMGKCSTCTFRIKETPNWLYGIWLDGNKFDIFGEHDELIDKFKPSRTYLSYNNKEMSFKDCINNFSNDVNNISKNPKIYFVDSLNWWGTLEPWKEYIDEYGDKVIEGYQKERWYNVKTGRWDIIKRNENMSQYQFVENEWREYWRRKKQEKIDEEIDYNRAIRIIKTISKMPSVDYVGVDDGCKNGWRRSPRFEIRLVIKDGYLEDQEKLNLYFKRLNGIIYTYKISTLSFENRVELDGLFTEYDDVKNLDYIYKDGKRIK